MAPCAMQFPNRTLLVLYSIRSYPEDLRSLTLHSAPRWAYGGVFFRPPAIPRSSSPGLGCEDGGLETQGVEPFELDRIEWAIEPPLRADADNRGVFELAGDHQGSGTGGGFVVPTG